MYHYDTIKQVHLEITSRCNAACPMCARNIRGGFLNPDLELSELTLDQIKTIFSEAFMFQLERIYLCGNYGDPMVARDLIPVVEYFRSENPEISLGMHTNGSGRNPDWWKRLARSFREPTSSVVFSIDGLEDTNHLYRQRTQWGRIMSAAESFIGAGGNAVWEYLIFEHNQHQVDEARDLAAGLGFKEFQAKKSGRFTSHDKLGWVDEYPVYDSEGNYTHSLKPATLDMDKNQLYRLEEKHKARFESVLQHPVPKPFEPFDPDKDFGEFGQYIQHARVACKAVQKSEIFINFQGLVFPCCWVGFPLHNWDHGGTNNQIKTLLHEYGLSRLDANIYTIEEIVHGELFQRTFPGGWPKGQSIQDGKLMICARHCGDQSHVQGEYEAKAEVLDVSNPE